MKKLKVFLMLALFIGTTGLAMAQNDAPYHRDAYRHWVRGRGWVVDYRYHRLIWDRYHHCWF
jgi:hypothetical protein